MRTASSQARTWSAAASASENTATVGTPSTRQVRAMRTAISPRLAMSSFMASHAKHAVAARAADLRRRHRREREPQHVARVAGIDDPVVPDLPRREECRRFLEHLIEERRLLHLLDQLGERARVAHALT